MNYSEIIHGIRFYCDVKSSFPKRVKSANPKIKVDNGNAIFVNDVLEKQLFINMYIYICIYSDVKSTFLKHNNQTWQWHCKAISWNGAYRVLEKSSSCGFNAGRPVPRL